MEKEKELRMVRV